MNSYLIDTISIRVIEVANPGCVGFSDPLGCIYHTVPVLLDPPSGWPDPAQPHTPRGDPAPALMLFNPPNPKVVLDVGSLCMSPAWSPAALCRHGAVGRSSFPSPHWVLMHDQHPNASSSWWCACGSAKIPAPWAGDVTALNVAPEPAS